MTDIAPAPAKKILYIDLDNTLVDFKSGISRLHPDVIAEYGEDLDDVPGIFGLMEPVDGALAAYRELAKHFDTYILSTAPWKNATAWNDKVLWVQRHLGKAEGGVAWKRLILSHHKNLNRGDFLIDDSPHNGADRFDGEWVPFGHTREGKANKYPTWASVLEYLLPLAGRSKLDEAIDLARSAHAGQRDKLGVDYIQHPLEVMRRVTTDDEKTVAVLHDVVEDTPVTAGCLGKRGFPAHILEAVEAITKRTGESLEVSMKRVLANPLALTVKRADISHNADPTRLGQLPEEIRAKLTIKYEESARGLGTTLEEILQAHKQ